MHFAIHRYAARVFAAATLARRRTGASGNGGGGYQAMPWSNSKVGADWTSGSAEGSCASPLASHNGGPRAGAIFAPSCRHPI